MKRLLLFTLVACCSCQEPLEKPLSDYVTTILNHFQQADPVGVPIVPIPDPLDVPPLTKSVGFATMTCHNVTLRGLSKFHIDHVHADLVDMQASGSIKLDTLNITGNYSLTSWLSNTSGNFTIWLTNVTIEATSGLQVVEGGNLEATEIFTEFYNENVTMAFEGLSPLLLGSSGTYIFESSKPYMMREINANLREQIAVQIGKLPHKFEESSQPIDQLIGRARQKARVYYEPLKLDDFVYSTKISRIALSHTWLYGLTGFRRVGEASVEMRNGSVVVKLDVEVENVNGTTQWEVEVMRGRRAGSAGFGVEHLQVEVTVGQPIDVRKPPRLLNIRLSLGDIRIGFEGAGSYDLPVVVLANLLPQYLNKQIIECLEALVKTKLIELFKDISLDEVVLGNLGRLDELYKRGTMKELLVE